MKNKFRILGAAAAGCLLGMTFLPCASAQVTDDAFNDLKKTVEQMNQQLQELQKTHQQDQQQIQDLQQKLGETRSMATNAVDLATNAVEKADAVALAQATPIRSALHNFTMVGDAEVQYGQAKGEFGTFSLADFAPIFLYRANDNILFEAGFDVTLQNNINAAGQPSGGSSTSVNLSFAQLDYLINDYVTFVGGYMLLPLGTYNERAAGWLNKIPDNPLANDLLIPGAGAGAQIRGAVPVGDSGQAVTYAIYGVNGPSSSDGTANAGSLDLGGNVGGDAVGSPNLNSEPSGGGRIGWFYPFKPHYDVELDVSGQSGHWSGSYLWSAIVLDAAVHLGPDTEVKAEYINTWQDTSNLGTIQPTGWWVQGSYKLAGLNLDAPIVNNLELVERYDYANNAMGSTCDRITTGLVYYFTDTLLLEGDYEWFINHGENNSVHDLFNDGTVLPVSQFIIQLSYGF